jgi:hypothetical protein
VRLTGFGGIIGILGLNVFATKLSSNTLVHWNLVFGEGVAMEIERLIICVVWRILHGCPWRCLFSEGASTVLVFFFFFSLTWVSEPACAYLD